MNSINANLNFGLQFARGRSRSRRNARKANHNAQIAMQLGQENQALKSEVQQLRGLVQQYQGAAQSAQLQAASSQGLLRGFQSGFAQSQASLLQGSVLGSLGALTAGNIGGLAQLSASFSGRAAFALAPARANFFHLAAFQHAHAFGF